MPMGLFLLDFHAFPAPAKIKITLYLPHESFNHCRVEKEAMFGKNDGDSFAM